MPEKVIEAQELVRIHRSSTGSPRKKKETPAVDGVSFSVPKGELFGVLGPNGAVKTATIKMLITLLTTTSGTANVLGFVKQDPSDVWKRIGPILGGYRGRYYRVSGGRTSHASSISTAFPCRSATAASRKCWT
jgi:ABC-type multidrug transport system ATPase subunit